METVLNKTRCDKIVVEQKKLVKDDVFLVTVTVLNFFFFFLNHN